ncbi:MAG TPA: acyl-CoA dehydrogenase family protein [Candidatus Acidoferrales bacterium]|nr:acyl-CoA dehydrogenase family protein [Candidatus Acidoferrales bacterium]
MDFALTEEQQLLKRTIREFALAEIAPGAAERDESARFPEELVPKMAGLGLFGIMVAEDYGGAGYDTLSAAIVIEELARVDAAVALSVSAHNALCAAHIAARGSEAQKRKFLVPLARGEKLGGWGLTEPGSGSDAAALQSRATACEDGWRISGEKQFVTNGSRADIYVVMASTDPARGKSGISAFIVERGAEGLVAGPAMKKLGVRASDTASLHFDGVRVAKENLLGELHEGFKDALRILAGARIGMAALAVGIAQGALDEAVRYAKARQQFGKPIAEFEAVQWMLADTATEIEAARLLVYRAARLKDLGRPFRQAASEAKLYAAEVAVRAASKAVQIHGGYGYIKGSPVERCFRDAKICEIGEGTSEVQRMVIAKELLRQTQ